MSLIVELPPGSRLAQTAEAAESVRRRLASIEDVVTIFSVIGVPSGTSADSAPLVHRAMLTMQLMPREQRVASQQQIQRAAVTAARSVAGVRVVLGARPGSKLQLTLVGNDDRALDLAAVAVQDKLRSMPGIGNVSSTAKLLQPEVVVQVIPERAANLGVTTDLIASVLRIGTTGDVEVNLPKLNLPNRQIPIRVHFSNDVRSNAERLRQIQIPSSAGAIPLTSVARVSLETRPSRITRLDRRRSVVIEADLQGAALGDAMSHLKESSALTNLPVGVRQLATGDAADMAELFSSFGKVMGIGVMCIYVVLLLLFRDWLQPLTMLSALPPSIAGAVVFIFVTNSQMSIPSLIGMLMLMGIATKNSILLVDYAIRAMRSESQERVEALVQACSRRARPIVMTTLAMGAGMLPIAAGWSGDPTFRAPMGIAVVGGLIVSTALSLLLVPVIFTFVDDGRMLAARAFGRLKPDTTPAGLVRSRTVRITRIDHVQLAMPPGGETLAREFYAHILGIPEVPKPAELAKRGGAWFEEGSVKIHLGVEMDFRPARKAHPALVVEDLASLVFRLRDKGYAVVDDDALEGYFRIFVSDPFGNRLELMEPQRTQQTIEQARKAKVPAAASHPTQICPEG